MSAWLVSGHKRLAQEKNIIASGISSLKVGIQEVDLHGDFEKHGSISFYSFSLENFLYFENFIYSCNEIRSYQLPTSSNSPHLPNSHYPCQLPFIYFFT